MVLDSSASTGSREHREKLAVVLSQRSAVVGFVLVV
ncbi:hypothetical protein CABS01_17262 [Colletotrichum abscissum]|uniref:Uncharacterized protein n=2 Tax=Colletotrichum acutatum species complex TaxID=2707335 RepID=A0AAI9YEI6_9PEZI|nr:uncharacterized protein CCOS01_16968 [Colletotrichum costaricense]XP_060372551.1 uncharacterized protein CTAM01_16883 [Colletotrichum tamarilloi]XP_060393352.1 uncharacterized protein CABS01_17262 [Colletotrichum abscissum]KAK1470247.1 hypothetical protein CTAM01_16883 [Colletotrichum tamarilloi]KAK1480582.1 hypothetical protein CABS01_17262 [Colletotrichum abscissum]KAK1503893.1 hypothetical protein CCOS01_16968 [Colletotrichum costaricense]